MLNRLIICILIPILFFSYSCKKNSNLPIYKNPSKTLDERVDNLLEFMTLDEKVNLFSGKDLWHFQGVERLGIPAIQVTDCGHGVTVILTEEGDYTGCSTCFPTAVTQAATWNRELINQVGAAIARETRATGSAILLAPMVNIHRTPINGRNYETYSEDPVLTGEMASAFIMGVQSEHIGACIKGFTANNQQTNQSGLNVQMSERTLREIYLPNFRIPVKKAKPWGLMTAYNGLNGSHTSANKHLLTEILRNEWSYEGFVVSDWRGVHDANKSLYAGLDIEMPGPGNFLTPENVIKAIETGVLTKNEVDKKAGRILKAIIKGKLLDNPKPQLNSELNSEKHKEIALKVAQEAIVLLKNNNALLPLEKNKLKKIAVIGPNAKEARLGGGGSASVTACNTVSPLQGLKNIVGDSVEILFEEGCGLNGNLQIIYTEFLTCQLNGNNYQGLKGEYFNNSDLSSEPTFTRIDDKIDFSWGWAAPGDGLRKNTYSVRWTGQIIPPVSGKYKIGVTCNEADCRLFLNDKLLINEWGNKNEIFEDDFKRKTKYFEILLKEGQAQDLKLEFSKKANKNSFRLEWEIPGKNDPIVSAKQLASECDAVIVFAGLSNLFEGGNNDREDILLPGQQNRLISEIASVNSNTIVVLVNGTPVSMPWIEDVNAVLEAFYPGQEGGNAIADILFGKINPSGKLPDTFPKTFEDHPSAAYFPGTEKNVEYNEEFWVGYRYFDTKNIEPLFPFGHGLSYTEFTYSNIGISKQNNECKVTFDLQNTGNKDGAEVVQLYINDLSSSVERPLKELKSFEKIFLHKGEKKKVEIVLDINDFAFFSEKEGKWILEPGDFKILVGSSSKDIRLRKVISI